MASCNVRVAYPEELRLAPVTACRSSQERAPPSGLHAACPPRCLAPAFPLRCRQCQGTVLPATEHSWGGRPAHTAVPLVSAPLLPLLLPSAGQAGGTALEVLAAWFGPHAATFLFSASLKASVKAKGKSSLFCPSWGRAKKRNCPQARTHRTWCGQLL